MIDIKDEQRYQVNLTASQIGYIKGALTNTIDKVNNDNTIIGGVLDNDVKEFINNIVDDAMVQLEKALPK